MFIVLGMLFPLCLCSKGVTSVLSSTSRKKTTQMLLVRPHGSLHVAAKTSWLSPALWQEAVGVTEPLLPGNSNRGLTLCQGTTHVLEQFGLVKPHFAFIQQL